MAEPIADDAFIVISGHHPQTGKRERISRVRAHITRRYFSKHHQRADAERVEAEQRSDLPSHPNRTRGRPDAGHFLVRNELRNSVPLTSHTLLDPAFFTTETTRRMHKCE